LLCGLIFPALAACGLFPVVLRDADRGSIQAVDIGDRIVLRLSGNASTGYVWRRVAPASFDGGALEPIEEGAYEPGGAADGNECGVGSPGTFVFRYRAAASGTTPLRYVYQRPWEEEPADEFDVVIWVR